MWVLIIMTSAMYFGSMGISQEFNTKEKCEVAMKWAKDKGYSAICVEK